jgi:hypothetical protein
MAMRGQECRTWSPPMMEGGRDMVEGRLIWHVNTVDCNDDGISIKTTFLSDDSGRPDSQTTSESFNSRSLEIAYCTAMQHD